MRALVDEKSSLNFSGAGDVSLPEAPQRRPRFVANPSGDSPSSRLRNDGGGLSLFGATEFNVKESVFETRWRGILIARLIGTSEGRLSVGWTNDLSNVPRSPQVRLWEVRNLCSISNGSYRGVFDEARSKLLS